MELIIDLKKNFFFECKAWGRGRRWKRTLVFFRQGDETPMEKVSFLHLRTK